MIGRRVQFAALGMLAAGLLLLGARPVLAGTPGVDASLRGAPAAACQTVLSAPGESESKPSGAITYFEWLNFVILVAVLVYFLRKPLAAYFSNRSTAIVRGLEEGRKALDESVAKLKSIEQKLERLNDDVAALTAEAAREMAAEADRMRGRTLSEAEKISESARAQIEAATRAAKMELKSFAAGQATEIAEQMVRGRLDRENQGKLVQRFFDGLNGRKQ